MKAVFENLKDLSPEVDYQALMAQMPHHSHPRRKLKELQNKGQLVRLKKGFYVLSKELIGRDYSPEIVANLLYGPSYLSLEYALSYYRLIPERVEVLTCVTTQKNKFFKTAIGSFSYQHLHAELYPLDVCLKQTDDGRNFLIASPEKALMDLFSLKFDNADLPKKSDVESALNDDLRIDRKTLKGLLTSAALQELKPHYKYRRWNKLLLDVLLEDL